MKGLKEFLVFLHENEDVMAEVEKVQNDSAKVVKIAKQHGYEFTESEYEALIFGAVAGGGFWKDFGRAFVGTLAGGATGALAGAPGGPIGAIVGALGGTAGAAYNIIKNG